MPQFIVRGLVNRDLSTAVSVRREVRISNRLLRSVLLGVIMLISSLIGTGGDSLS